MCPNIGLLHNDFTSDCFRNILFEKKYHPRTVWGVIIHQHSSRTGLCWCFSEGKKYQSSTVHSILFFILLYILCNLYVLKYNNMLLSLILTKCNIFLLLFYFYLLKWFYACLNDLYWCFLFIWPLRSCTEIVLYSMTTKAFHLFYLLEMSSIHLPTLHASCIPLLTVSQETKPSCSVWGLWLTGHLLCEALITESPYLSIAVMKGVTLCHDKITGMLIKAWLR